MSFAQLNAYLGRGKSTIVDSEDAIGPFVGDWVELTVQLTHGNGLRVNDANLHLVFIHQSLYNNRERNTLCL